MLPSALLLLAAAGSASAHFKIAYPPWRADSLDNDSYSQFTYPCAGVPATTAGAANRTDWPVDGGSLRLDLHHTASFLFINIGLGANASNFNYTLTLPTFWNETGKGTLCLPQLALPADLAPVDGQEASLQVVTVTTAGEALYNCADITFRTGTTLAPFGGDNCTTSDNVHYEAVAGSDGSNGTAAAATSSAASSSSASGTAAATSGGAPTVAGAGPAWMAVGALAVAFVVGMGA